jgi:glycosyltransferase involved in cell wall biosynthesis
MNAHEPLSQLDIMYLTDSWRWFGRHSGYAGLIDFIPPEGNRASLFTCNVPSRNEDLQNRILSLLRGRAWCCTGRDRQQEALFVESLHSHPTAIGHVLYYERHHPLFRAWEKAPRNLVTTIHHPMDQLRTLHRTATDDLSHLSSALVLYQRDLAFFESHVGKGRVKFVHHGVDTGFFRPVERDYDDGRPPRILFVGINGRNLKMLHEVVQQVCRERSDVEFHLLVPSRRGDSRNHVYFSRLKRIEQVKWRSNLSDQELLDLYRKSYLLLLPLD